MPQKIKGRENKVYNPAQDPLYSEVLDFVSKNKNFSILLLQKKFKISFERAALLIEHIEKEKESPSHQPKILVKEKENEEIIKKTNKNDNVKLIVILFIFLLCGFCTFIYFKDSIGSLFNIMISIIIAFFVSGGILFLISTEDKFLNDGYSSKNFTCGITSLVLAILTFFLIRGFFYVSPEIREERIKFAQMQHQAMERREIEETDDFVRSGDLIKLYGIANNDKLSLINAKSAIQKFAHDPDSVQDVEVLSHLLRVRIREYPQCRYALNVQFRAKNSFGALVKQTAVILFDKNMNGFKVLEKSLF